MNNELILLVEERSRLGDRGQVLMLPEIPDDDLCRVIVDYKSTQDGDVQFSESLHALKQKPPTQNYPKLIGLAAANLAQDGWLWGVGEVESAEVPLLKQEHKEAIATTKTNEKYSLVAFDVSARSVNENTVWPFYTGDIGLRIFAFNRRGTELEGRLETLRAFIHDNAPSTATLWRQIYQECISRRSLLKLCQDITFCVLPDGPDYNEVSFQSSIYGAYMFVDNLCNLARIYQISCLAAPNTNE